jgi:hypothetical protein
MLQQKLVKSKPTSAHDCNVCFYVRAWVSVLFVMRFAAGVLYVCVLCSCNVNMPSGVEFYTCMRLIR